MSTPTTKSLSTWFKEEGLLLLGVAPLRVEGAYQNYLSWLSEGRHANLFYLEQHLELRRNPSALLAQSQTAIIFALPYFQGNDNERFRIAQYARFRDYHRELKERGERVAEKFREKEGGATRVLVDSAPVLERALASQTEAGFVGKNTCYIHPTHGSFLLLGEILTTVPLTTDSPPSIDLERKTMEGGCGPCNLCQTACPTGALNEDYTIDSRKCLSYWTIEHRGPIPEEFWPHLEKYIFGCDICQQVCPYNKQAKPLPSSLKVREFPELFEMATMDQAAYERYFGGTPATRAKKEGLQRNALIAMAVTKHPRLRDAMSLVGTNTNATLRATVDQIVSSEL